MFDIEVGPGTGIFWLNRLLPTFVCLLTTFVCLLTTFVCLLTTFMCLLTTIDNFIQLRYLRAS